MRLLSRSVFFCLVFCLISVSKASANSLSISNVSLGTRSPSGNTLVVEFDVSWQNSWKTKINHDAVWLTVRLHNPSVVPTEKRLCQITASGLNPSGTSQGSNSNLEMYVPSDRYGAFLRPAAYGMYNSVSSTSVRVTVDYDSCGFSDSDTAYASVLGIEMSYVPQGSFYAGDYGTGTAAFDQGSADSDPWQIQSESSISVSNPASNGYRYVSAGNSGEDASGSSFSIPAGFPKGFKGFYAMKYEVTEGQWVEFVNSIPAAARANRDLTDSNHKNTDSVVARNTISCSGSPLSCSTDRSFRAIGYLSWMDLVAFLDWAALRPMTELEFEKISRGPFIPAPGEFSWGTADVTAATAISGGNENGEETVTNTDANANYDNITFTGGDSSNGVDYSQGPLRGGIFASSSSTRVTAGSGFYGNMELSGNVAERIVTIGNSSGRVFAGAHGNGVLVSVSGYEGNADVSDWPGIDAVPTRGVTSATGSGLRGGSWSDQSSGAKLRISDRTDAANGASTALNNTGGRGARTYDGN